MKQMIGQGAICPGRTVLCPLAAQVCPLFREKYRVPLALCGLPTVRGEAGEARNFSQSHHLTIHSHQK
ncbi:hypothetical protein WJX84_007676 [Apatococcus fuscideae]|uniref:Uncharacterized protein n=1 Tax=Apatococcus fuscideae TaxID=2026836 RepID=A0AAW1T0G3_9CHLO